MGKTYRYLHVNGKAGKSILVIIMYYMLIPIPDIIISCYHAMQLNA